MTTEDAMTVRLDQHRRDLDRIDRHLDKFDEEKAEAKDLVSLTEAVEGLRETLTKVGIGVILTLMTLVAGLAAQLLMQAH